MIFWACTNYFNAVTLKINTNFKEVGLKFLRHDCKQSSQSLCPFVLYYTKLKKWCFNTKPGSEKDCLFFLWLLSALWGCVHGRDRQLLSLGVQGKPGGQTSPWFEMTLLMQTLTMPCFCFCFFLSFLSFLS